MSHWRQQMALNFESDVKNHWEKLVNDKWLKIKRHLPFVGVNVTSQFGISEYQNSSPKTTF